MQSGTHSHTRASKAATLSPPKATVASVLQSAFATWQATAQQQRHQGLLRQAELLRKARLAQAWSQMARDRQLVRGCFQSWQDQAARQKEADSVLLAQAVTGQAARMQLHMVRAWNHSAQQTKAEKARQASADRHRAFRLQRHAFSLWYKQTKQACTHAAQMAAATLYRGKHVQQQVWRAWQGLVQAAKVHSASHLCAT